MKLIPADRKYTDTHLWFLSLAGEQGTVGITDELQSRLGDIIAADLPRPGTLLSSHEVAATLEGLLETFELEAFSNMEVLEINPRLEIHPDLINRQPYADGWILRVRLIGVPRWLDAPGYAEFLQKGLITEGA